MLSRSRRSSWGTNSQKGLTLATQSRGSTLGSTMVYCGGVAVISCTAAQLINMKPLQLPLLGHHLGLYEVLMQFK